MIKIIGYIAAVGFVVCLVIMYVSDKGVKGLRKYDANFKLLDMRFHYNADDVVNTFEKLGKDGIAAYRNYWITDFVFIACFLILMLSITNCVTVNLVKNLMLILSVSRAVFDVAENGILLYLSGIYPIRKDTLAAICSWVTTFKFAALYVWIFGLSAMIILKGIK